MQNKQQVNFYLKPFSQRQLQVYLNNKYIITDQHQLYNDLSILVYYITQKDSRLRKQYKFLNIRYYSSLEYLLGKTKIEEKCMICLDQYQIQKDLVKYQQDEHDEDVVMLACSHKYHRGCFKNMMGKNQWVKCAVCSAIFGVMEGDQPDGRMEQIIDKNLVCKGYDKGTIIITYSFKGGIRNGKQFPGTTRMAYLPNNKQGQQVLLLLKESWKRRLTFTVGRSVTTGLDNQIVWNGIHHKTNVSGGSANFGYPDETYFKRVKEQLAAKGIVAIKQ